MGCAAGLKKYMAACAGNMSSRLFTEIPNGRLFAALRQNERNACLYEKRILEA